MTLDNRIKVNAVNLKRVNPGKSDAGFQTSVHHDSEKGNSKRRNASVHEECGAIVLARVKEKAGARMCEVCRGYKTHEEERGKENFCMCDRFSADGFRTRAARVIRRRVLGVRATKVKTGKE